MTSYAYGGARWAFYLALSAVAMMVVSTNVKLNKPIAEMLVPPVIKLKLVALAAPKVAVMPAAIASPKSIQQPVAKNKIVTTKTAIKKIAVLPVQPRPVLKPVEPPAKTKPKISQDQPKKNTPVVMKSNLSMLNKPMPKPVKQAVVEQVEKQLDVAPVLPDVDVRTKAKTNGQSQSTIIQNARYRKQTAPVYPRRALELGQQGVVTLHAEVMPDGLPRTLKIAKSSGHRLLDIAAMSAVKKWEFEPINIKGSPTTSWVKVPVRFIVQ